ncbi:hypothetical protein [Nocardia sp. NPDC004711]
MGELADLMVNWKSAGLNGFRLRPAVLPDDLQVICRDLVPQLQSRAGFRTAYEATTLRSMLGLPRPISRFADASQ